MFLYCCQLSVFNRCWVRPLLQSLCHCTACACLCHSTVHTRCCFATLYQLLRLTASAVIRFTREEQMIGIKPHFPCRPLLIDWFTIGFETLRSRCTLVSVYGPFVPHIILWEPCSFAGIPDSPQTYTLDVPWLLEGGRPDTHVWGKSKLHTHKECGLRFHPLLHTSYTTYPVVSGVVLPRRSDLHICSGHTSGRSGSCLWVAWRVVCGIRLQNVDSLTWFLV